MSHQGAPSLHSKKIRISQKLALKWTQTLVDLHIYEGIIAGQWPKSIVGVLLWWIIWEGAGTEKKLGTIHGHYWRVTGRIVSQYNVSFQFI